MELVSRTTRQTNTCKRKQSKIIQIIQNKRLSIISNKGTDTHRPKPASDVIHCQKHWFKDRVKNHIGVRKGVEIKRLDQHTCISQHFSNPERQSAPCFPAWPEPHTAQRLKNRAGTTAHPASVMHTLKIEEMTQNGYLQPSGRQKCANAANRGF